MSSYGSVFLGDVQRHRILSTSTPPSSPPADLSPASQTFSQVQLDTIDDMDNVLEIEPGLVAETLPETQQQEQEQPPPTIPPALSMDLRIRWLETLVYGAKQQGAKGHERHNATLMRGVEELQRRLEGIVHSSEGLKRFMDHCTSSFPSPTHARSHSHSHTHP